MIRVLLDIAESAKATHTRLKAVELLLKVKEVKNNELSDEALKILGKNESPAIRQKLYRERLKLRLAQQSESKITKVGGV